MSTLERSVAKLTKFLYLENWATHKLILTHSGYIMKSFHNLQFCMAGVAYPLVFLARLLCSFDEICHRNTLFIWCLLYDEISMHIHCKSIECLLNCETTANMFLLFFGIHNYSYVLLPSALHTDCDADSSFGEFEQHCLFYTLWHKVPAVLATFYVASIV